MPGSTLLRARKLGNLRAFRHPTITYGVDYNSYSGSKVLDAYAPPNVSPITIVHVHGGGWTSSTSCTGFGAPYSDPSVRNIASHLVSRGFCVLNIEYDLLAACTDNTTDTTKRDSMISDVLAAVRYARLNAGAYNGNPERVVLFGESAGAHLCLMAAIQGLEGDSRPDAVVSWSGLSRLDQASGAAPHGIVANYLGVSDARSGAGQTAAQARSPYNQWVAGIRAPVRIAMYTTDAIRQADGTDLRDAILAVSGAVTYAETSGTSHADFSGQAEMDTAAAWIRANTSRSPYPIPLVSSSNGGNGNTPSGSSTPTALTAEALSHTMLTVLVMEYGSSTHITGITQNGVALTRIGSPTTSGGMTGSVWYLASPTTGNLTLTGDGVQAMAYSAVIWYGAASVAPTVATHTATGYSPSVSFTGANLGVSDLLGLIGAPSVDSTAPAQTRYASTGPGVGTGNSVDYESTLLGTNPTVGWTVDSEYPSSHVYLAVAVGPA